jgi:hypothetical protein
VPSFCAFREAHRPIRLKAPSSAAASTLLGFDLNPSAMQEDSAAYCRNAQSPDCINFAYDIFLTPNESAGL